MSIPIRDNLFGVKGCPAKSIIRKIGVTGFAVLTCLLIMSTNKVAITTAKQIMLRLNIKTPNPVFAALRKLEQNGLISVNVKSGKLWINEVVYINLEPYLNLATADNGVIWIPSSLFINNCSEINASGWALYCLLTFLHNSKTGYAYPSENYLSEALGLSIQTISKYTSILVNNRLIKVIPQKVLVHTELKAYRPTNRYVVFAKYYKLKKLMEVKNDNR